jgi:hypothetical protein
MVKDEVTTSGEEETWNVVVVTNMQCAGGRAFDIIPARHGRAWTVLFMVFSTLSFESICGITSQSARFACDMNLALTTTVPTFDSRTMSLPRPVLHYRPLRAEQASPRHRTALVVAPTTNRENKPLQPHLDHPSAQLRTRFGYLYHYTQWHAFESPALRSKIFSCHRHRLPPDPVPARLCASRPQHANCDTPRPKTQTRARFSFRKLP